MTQYFQFEVVWLHNSFDYSVGRHGSNKYIPFKINVEIRLTV